MPSFSELSLARLSTCHPDLQRLFGAVILKIDCTALDGYRSEALQNRAFDEGKSKVRWPDGKHNKFPSDAVDVGPWPLDWNDWKSFYYFGGIVMATAWALGIDIRWGGDWNGNNDLKDQNFFDLVHFERRIKT